MQRTTVALRAADRRLLLRIAEMQETDGVHGWRIAGSTRGRRVLPSHGGLYSALHRLVRRGLLIRSVEDPATARAAGRPARRLYRLSPEGAAAIAPRRHPVVVTSVALGAAS